MNPYKILILLKKEMTALRLEGIYPCYYLELMWTRSWCGYLSSVDTWLSPGRDKWRSNINYNEVNISLCWPKAQINRVISDGSPMYRPKLTDSEVIFHPDQ